MYMVVYYAAPIFFQASMVMLVAVHFAGAVEIWFLEASTGVALAHAGNCACISTARLLLAALCLVLLVFQNFPVKSTALSTVSSTTVLL